jgi:class 3 adenylate cyclase
VGVSVVDLPSGTVTLLFTDLEGSTRLWDTHPEAMRGALAHHDEILRSAITTRSGHVVKTTGAVDALVPGMRDWGCTASCASGSPARSGATVAPDTFDRLHAQGVAMTLDDAKSFVAALIERELAAL